MDDARRIWSLKRRGCTYEQIAEITGIPLDELRAKMRQRRSRENDPQFADPNELLIQLTASAIQLTWSPSERRSRLIAPDTRVTYDSPTAIALSRN